MLKDAAQTPCCRLNKATGLMRAIVNLSPLVVMHLGSIKINSLSCSLAN